MAPSAAAVTTCRSDLDLMSPAQYKPGVVVPICSSVSTPPSGPSSAKPATRFVAGSCPTATKMPTEPSSYDSTCVSPVALSRNVMALINVGFSGESINHSTGCTEHITANDDLYLIGKIR